MVRLMTGIGLVALVFALPVLLAGAGDERQGRSGRGKPGVALAAQAGDGAGADRAKRGQSVRPAPVDVNVHLPERGPGGVVQSLPDLKIVAVEPDGPSKFPETVTVANHGLAPASTFDLEIEGSLGRSGTPKYRIEVFNRSPLGRAQQVKVRVPKGFGYRGHIKVDPRNKVREADEGNNGWSIVPFN